MGRSVRDCVVWAVIIGGHALLIAIFAGGKRQVSLPSANLPSPGVLILLDLPPPPSDAAAPDVQAPQLVSAPVLMPRLPLSEIDPNSTAITLPEDDEAGPGSNAIDWALEAERSAHIVAGQNPKRGQKRIGEHPPSPFREKKKPREFEWDPEPPRVGFAPGFIPYVRIGQRCVVGLGFLGCRLGKLPEANGHLFDGMKDPDRQRSSVPEIDTSSALDPPPD